MGLPIEDLLLFLQRVGLQYALIRDSKGKFIARIFGKGYFKFENSSSESMRAALCDALSRWLSEESRDYHDINPNQCNRCFAILPESWNKVKHYMSHEEQESKDNTNE
jgi:hypothetical protein